MKIDIGGDYITEEVITIEIPKKEDEIIEESKEDSDDDEEEYEV